MGKSKDSKKVKAQQPTLFTPFTLRGITARNRIWMPPMDTYSAFAQATSTTSTMSREPWAALA